MTFRKEDRVNCSPDPSVSVSRMVAWCTGVAVRERGQPRPRVYPAGRAGHRAEGLLLVRVCSHHMNHRSSGNNTWNDSCPHPAFFTALSHTFSHTGHPG